LRILVGQGLQEKGKTVVRKNRKSDHQAKGNAPAATRGSGRHFSVEPRRSFTFSGRRGS
jgi:hypothetical protein